MMACETKANVASTTRSRCNPIRLGYLTPGILRTAGPPDRHMLSGESPEGISRVTMVSRSSPDDEIPGPGEAEMAFRRALNRLCMACWEIELAIARLSLLSLERSRSTER